jgi:hypothetical protein
MGKLKESLITLEEMVEQGFTATEISNQLGVSYDLAMQYIFQRHELELQKQHEFMSYGEQNA